MSKRIKQLSIFTIQKSKEADLSKVCVMTGKCYNSLPKQEF